MKHGSQVFLIRHGISPEVCHDAYNMRTPYGRFAYSTSLFNMNLTYSSEPMCLVLGDVRLMVLRDM